MNEAKTSDKNTGPRPSTTLKTACKNSSPPAKIPSFTQIVTQHGFALTPSILDHDWLKDNWQFSKPMISHKIMTKILCRNFEKSFLT